MPTSLDAQVITLIFLCVVFFSYSAWDWTSFMVRCSGSFAQRFLLGTFPIQAHVFLISGSFQEHREAQLVSVGSVWGSIGWCMFGEAVFPYLPCSWWFTCLAACLPGPASQNIVQMLQSTVQRIHRSRRTRLNPSSGPAQAYTLAWLPMHNILKLSSDSVIWTMFVMATAACSSALGRDSSRDMMGFQTWQILEPPRLWSRQCSCSGFSSRTWPSLR